VTLVVFWPTLGHQFLDWDDDRNLVNNPDFRGLGWANVRWMLTTTLMGHWIPFTWLTFGADYVIWGMKAFGYHLTNLLLHSGAAARRSLRSLAPPHCPDLPGVRRPDGRAPALVAGVLAGLLRPGPDLEG